MHRTSSRFARLRPSAVNAILGEVREQQARGVRIYSLLRGEPNFRTDPRIVEALMESLRNGRTMYPDNRGERNLREAVAHKLARENHVQYDPGTEILITGGATYGLCIALGAILEHGDEVLLPEPIYDVYHSQILLAGGVPRPVPTHIVNQRFTLRVEDLEAATNERTRALILNSPWNPTATVFTPAEIAAYGEFVCRRNLTLLSDEIYEKIVYPPHVHLSPASLSEELRQRTVLVSSLSKTYAMTGWRIGYCAGPEPILNAMYLLLQQSSRGPATFVQDAAAAALNNSQENVESMLREYQRRRTLILDHMASSQHCVVLPPEGGFFAMLDVRHIPLSSDEIRKKLLHDFGVVVIHGAAYGPSGEGTLRISFASGGDVLDDGIARLRNGLEAIAERSRG